MIEQLADFPENVVAFVCKRRVTKADYDMVPHTPRASEASPDQGTLVGKCGGGSCHCAVRPPGVDIGGVALVLLLVEPMAESCFVKWLVALLGAAPPPIATYRDIGGPRRRCRARGSSLSAPLFQQHR
jgi:hypothetical protein